MRRPRHSEQGQPPMDLVEDAVQLLRAAPPWIHALHLACFIAVNDTPLHQGVNFLSPRLGVSLGDGGVVKTYFVRILLGVRQQFSAEFLSDVFAEGHDGVIYEQRAEVLDVVKRCPVQIFQQELGNTCYAGDVG